MLGKDCSHVDEVGYAAMADVMILMPSKRILQFSLFWLVTEAQNIYIPLALLSSRIDWES